MDRRSLIRSSLLGVGGISLAGLAASRRGIAEEAILSTGSPTDDVINAALECIRTGNSCVAHCMRELANGDTAMAHCNSRVHDMLIFCEGTLKLASYGSDKLKAFAALCADACRDCKAACFEHHEHWPMGMHMECKACFDACNKCEAACRALASN